METIKEVLINRDGYSPENADKLIIECRDECLRRLNEGEFPFDICEEYFGLEPDYLDDLVNYI